MRRSLALWGVLAVVARSTLTGRRTASAARNSPTPIAATGLSTAGVDRPVAPESLAGTVRDREHSERWWGWLTPSGLLSVGTLLALLAYGISYYFARRFYAEFGLSPADAGYSQQDALADAIYYLVALTVLALLSAPVLWGLRFIVRRSALRSAERPRAAVRRVLAVATVVILCPALALGVFNAWQFLRVVGADQARQIQNPEYVPTSALERDAPWPLPGIQVTFGEARWTSPSTNGAVDTRRAAVTLLGVRDGSAVFWDHCSDLVRRVSTDALTFVSIPDFFDPGSDLLPEGVARSGISEFCAKNVTEPG